MPEYVDPAVEKLRDSESEDRVTLLVGVSGDREDVQERLRKHGATVEDSLGRATIRVTVPTSQVDVLCDLDGVKSIEIERDDVRILDSGNGRSRRRVTRS